MSKFVIMEMADGFSQPVAIRDTHEIAVACCVKLANLWSQKVQGLVQPFEDGVRCLASSEVDFNVVEVEDVSEDLS